MPPTAGPSPPGAGGRQSTSTNLPPILPDPERQPSSPVAGDVGAAAVVMVVPGAAVDDGPARRISATWSASTERTPSALNPCSKETLGSAAGPPAGGPDCCP
ncbi:unnamed protein product, partial [Ectocarpus sp. 12 AP-2014]